MPASIRASVAMDVCCLTNYQSLIDAGGLSKHGVYYFVPGVEVLDTFQINELIVPRAHLSVNGDGTISHTSRRGAGPRKTAASYRTYGKLTTVRSTLRLRPRGVTEMRREILHGWTNTYRTLNAAQSSEHRGYKQAPKNLETQYSK